VEPVMKKHAPRFKASLAAVILAAAVSVPATAAPAFAEVEGDCWSNLGWWSVQNVYCTPAIYHVSILTGGRQILGSRAMPGQTSNQSACWADAISYSFTY